ncbi:MAG: hypothetical protein JRJ09_10385 [Deltaproteobacteria bacterium]|nr:hypothetical protein [Deltaproteobacteria bacterium]HDZ89695.1 hypothetical protein [Deltaproteobacteria bacterium]
MNGTEQAVDPALYLKRFTMIVGEVNTGKTFLTQKILDACCLQGLGRVAVVDLAPDIPAALLRGKTEGIGGTLSAPEMGDTRYFHCPIHAPRLEGGDGREVLDLAARNERGIQLLFEEALKWKPDLLFINDCSLYLHRGRVQRLMGWILSVETSVVNGYYGRTLGGGPLSAREREGMDLLIRGADRVIRLPEGGHMKHRGGTR